MKAYLEIITDEVRQVKNGEYYLIDGEIIRRIPETEIEVEE